MRIDDVIAELELDALDFARDDLTLPV